MKWKIYVDNYEIWKHRQREENGKGEEHGGGAGKGGGESA